MPHRVARLFFNSFWRVVLSALRLNRLTFRVFVGHLFVASLEIFAIERANQSIASLLLFLFRLCSATVSSQSQQSQQSTHKQSEHFDCLRFLVLVVVVFFEDRIVGRVCCCLHLVNLSSTVVRACDYRSRSIRRLYQVFQMTKFQIHHHRNSTLSSWWPTTTCNEWRQSISNQSKTPLLFIYEFSTT